MRVGRHQLYVKIARCMAERSTCFRLNVGAVVTHDNNIISCGYNGPPSGEPHCQGNDCPLSKSGGCTRSLHAEANAINRIPIAPYDKKFRLYCTTSPCMSCAQIIASSHVSEVYFETLYRDTEPIMYLLEYNVRCFQVSPSGYIIEPLEKKIIEHPDA